jgi:hypothetical protein
MKHTVRMAGVIVGHSELEHTVPEDGRAWGTFRPGLGYGAVQPVFRLFAQAVPREGGETNAKLLKRYYRRREKLQLELRGARGVKIPTSAIHIVDYSVEDGSMPLQLEVLISDPAYWNLRAGDQ